MEIAQTEVFGPVLSVMRYSTEEEALSIINGTEYGLVGGVFTKDLNKAHRLSQKFEQVRFLLMNGLQAVWKPHLVDLVNQGTDEKKVVRPYGIMFKPKTLPLNFHEDYLYNSLSI